MLPAGAGAAAPGAGGGGAASLGGAAVGPGCATGAPATLIVNIWPGLNTTLP